MEAPGSLGINYPLIIKAVFQLIVVSFVNTCLNFHFGGWSSPYPKTYWKLPCHLDLKRSTAFVLLHVAFPVLAGEVLQVTCVSARGISSPSRASLFHQYGLIDGLSTEKGRDAISQV